MNPFLPFSGCAAEYVRPEVEFRLRYVIQEAQKRCAHRRGETLSGEDVLAAYMQVTAAGSAPGSFLAGPLRLLASSRPGRGAARTLRVLPPTFPPTAPSLAGLYGAPPSKPAARRMSLSPLARSRAATADVFSDWPSTTNPTYRNEGKHSRSRGRMLCARKGRARPRPPLPRR